MPISPILSHYPPKPYPLNVEFKPSSSKSSKTVEEIISDDLQSPDPFFKEVKKGFNLNKKIKGPIIIGITGEAASGKTTIVKNIQKASDMTGVPVTFMHMDDYFNDTSELMNKYGGYEGLLETGFEFDSPDNMQMDLLNSDLKKLKNNKRIFSPKYLPNGTGISIPEYTLKTPSPIIVLEGINSTDKKLDDVLDVKIYLEVDPKVRKDRYYKREPERGETTLDEIDCRYNNTTKMGKKFIKPHRDEADIILNGNVSRTKEYEISKKILKALVQGDN